MDAQSIIAYVLVAIAALYLIKILFFRKKSKKGCGGGPDCKCGG